MRVFAGLQVLEGAAHRRVLTEGSGGFSDSTWARIRVGDVRRGAAASRRRRLSRQSPRHAGGEDARRWRGTIILSISCTLRRGETVLTSCRSTASSFSTLGAKSGGAERGPQRRSYTAPFIINLAIPVCIDCAWALTGPCPGLHESARKWGGGE